MQNILPLKDFYASREGVHTKQIVIKWALPGDHLSPLLIQESWTGRGLLFSENDDYDDDDGGDDFDD